MPALVSEGNDISICVNYSSNGVHRLKVNISWHKTALWGRVMYSLYPINGGWPASSVRQTVSILHLHKHCTHLHAWKYQYSSRESTWGSILFGVGSVGNALVLLRIRHVKPVMSPYEWDHIERSQDIEQSLWCNKRTRDTSISFTILFGR